MQHWVNDYGVHFNRVLLTATYVSLFVHLRLPLGALILTTLACQCPASGYRADVQEIDVCQCLAAAEADLLMVVKS